MKAAGEKVKKEGTTKSPTVKRPKEIQYSRLLFIQHYFNGTELKNTDDNEKDEVVQPIIDADADDAEKKEENPDKDDKDQDGDKPKDETEKKEEGDENQIDSGAPKQDAEEDAGIDDRAEEVHDCEERSDAGNPEPLPNPYDNDEPLMLEINSKSKSRCLKKVILEKLHLEGANMLLYKQT